MEKLIIFCFLFNCILCNCQSHAQEIKTNINKERYIDIYNLNTPVTYIAPFNHFGAPKDFILTTRINTNFFLFGSKTTRLAICAYPNFEVRILQDNKKFGDSSLPVRTPNFKGGGEIFYSIEVDKIKTSYISGGFYHFSNGQDGVAKINGVQNTYNGNFSTNWIYFTSHIGRFYPSYNWDIGTRWDIMPKWIGHDDSYDGTYGYSRISLQSRLSLFNNYYTNKAKRKLNTLDKETWRFNFDLSLATNKMFGEKNKLSKRINCELSGNYIPTWSRNTGLHIALGYYGEDPYNVYYLDSYPYLRLGLSTSLFLYKSRFYGNL